MGGPIVCRALWLAVIEAAGGQCECSSACGKNHRGGRCQRIEGQGVHSLGRIHLSAVPKRLGMPFHMAASLPAADLKAVCPECFKGMAASNKKAAEGRAAAATEQASLF